MAQNISLLGAVYSAVPAILLPKQGGGTARFDDATVTTAAASDVAQGKIFLASDGTITTGTASGGGISPDDAVIKVTAPAGSTVTITKGGSSKSQDSSDAHIQSDDSSRAAYYFSLKTAEYGTWTVTATGTFGTATDTVEVSSNKQYDVILRNELWLVTAGMFSTALSHNNADGTLTENYNSGGYARLYRAKSGSGYAYGYFYDGSIDMRSISVDHFKYLVCEHRVMGSGAKIKYGLTTTNTSNPTWEAGYSFGTSQISSLTAKETTYLDISSITGNYWVGFSTGGNTNVAGEFQCYNLYLTDHAPW